MGEIRLSSSLFISLPADFLETGPKRLGDGPDESEELKEVWLRWLQEMGTVHARLVQPSEYSTPTAAPAIPFSRTPDCLEIPADRIRWEEKPCSLRGFASSASLFFFAGPSKFTRDLHLFSGSLEFLEFPTTSIYSTSNFETPLSECFRSLSSGL